MQSEEMLSKSPIYIRRSTASPRLEKDSQDDINQSKSGKAINQSSNIEPPNRFKNQRSPSQDSNLSAGIDVDVEVNPDTSSESNEVNANSSFEETSINLAAENVLDDNTERRSSKRLRSTNSSVKLNEKTSIRKAPTPKKASRRKVSVSDGDDEPKNSKVSKSSVTTRNRRKTTKYQDWSSSDSVSESSGDPSASEPESDGDESEENNVLASESEDEESSDLKFSSDMEATSGRSKKLKRNLSSTSLASRTKSSYKTLRINVHENRCYRCGGRKKLSRCSKCTQSFHEDCIMSKSPDLCGDCRRSEPKCTLCKEDNVKDESDGAIEKIEPPVESNQLLFRCCRCDETVHLDCLVSQLIINPVRRTAKLKKLPYFLRDHHCHQCLRWPHPVEAILDQGHFEEPPNPGNAFSVTCCNPAISKYNMFLVKFNGISHRFDAWVPESWLKRVSFQKMKNFLRDNSPKSPLQKPNGHSPSTQHQNHHHNSVVSAEWMLPDRVLAISEDQFDESGDEVEDRTRSIYNAEPPKLDHFKTQYLIKWKEMQYEDCSWEYAPFKTGGNGTPDDDSFKDCFEKSLERYREKNRINSSSAVTKFQQLEKSGRFKKDKDSFKTSTYEDTPKFIINGSLMKHQLEGLNWLLYQWLSRQSCILADEMGMGKTIQTIALISAIYDRYKLFPFIVIVPNSTVGNWLNEFERWVPHLDVVAYSGMAASRSLIEQYELFHDKRKGHCKFHVLITTYESLLLDTTIFKGVHWQAMILDEGHRLKNDQGLLFNKIIDFNVVQRIILTGTPLQNNVREILNLLYFLEPSKFGDREERAKEFEEEMSKENIEELHNLLRPRMLRRTKDDSLALPPKVEIIVPVSMAKIQRTLYRAILTGNYKSLNSKGGRSNRRTGLDSILVQLRKCLNHPYLFPDNEPDFDSEVKAHQALINASGKLMFLHRLLRQLKEDGHRVLIFSQMTSMLDVLEDYMEFEGYKYTRFDGSTPRLLREERIGRFNAPDSDLFCFLLSTRAGGYGINLVSADTVIIYDPDYNPHADLQALCRAHRIGQKKTVLVLKLVAEKSAEEKIVTLGRKKLLLDHVVVEMMDDKKNKNGGTGIEDTELEDILRYGAKELFERDRKKKKKKKGADDDVAAGTEANKDDSKLTDQQPIEVDDSDESEEDDDDISIVYDEKRIKELLAKRYEEVKDTTDDKKGPGGSSNAFSFAEIWNIHGTSSDDANKEGSQNGESGDHDESSTHPEGENKQKRTDDEINNESFWKDLLEEYLADTNNNGNLNGNERSMNSNNPSEEMIALFGKGKRQRKAVSYFGSNQAPGHVHNQGHKQRGEEKRKRSSLEGGDPDDFDDEDDQELNVEDEDSASDASVAPSEDDEEDEEDDDLEDEEDGIDPTLGGISFSSDGVSKKNSGGNGSKGLSNLSGKSRDKNGNSNNNGPSNGNTKNRQLLPDGIQVPDGFLLPAKKLSFDEKRELMLEECIKRLEHDERRNFDNSNTNHEKIKYDLERLKAALIEQRAIIAHKKERERERRRASRRRKQEQKRMLLHSSNNNSNSASNSNLNNVNSINTGDQEALFLLEMARGARNDYYQSNTNANSRRNSQLMEGQLNNSASVNNNNNAAVSSFATSSAPSLPIPSSNPTATTTTTSYDIHRQSILYQNDYNHTGDMNASVTYNNNNTNNASSSFNGNSDLIGPSMGSSLKYHQPIINSTSSASINSSSNHHLSYYPPPPSVPAPPPSSLSYPQSASSSASSYYNTIPPSQYPPSLPISSNVGSGNSSSSNNTQSYGGNGSSFSNNYQGYSSNNNYQSYSNNNISNSNHNYQTTSNSYNSNFPNTGSSYNYSQSSSSNAYPSNEYSSSTVPSNTNANNYYSNNSNYNNNYDSRGGYGSTYNTSSLSSSSHVPTPTAGAVNTTTSSNNPYNNASYYSNYNYQNAATGNSNNSGYTGTSSSSSYMRSSSSAYNNNNSINNVSNTNPYYSGATTNYTSSSSSNNYPPSNASLSYPTSTPPNNLGNNALNYPSHGNVSNSLYSNSSSVIGGGGVGGVNVPNPSFSHSHNHPTAYSNYGNANNYYYNSNYPNNTPPPPISASMLSNVTTGGSAGASQQQQQVQQQQQSPPTLISTSRSHHNQQ